MEKKDQKDQLLVPKSLTSAKKSSIVTKQIDVKNDDVKVISNEKTAKIAVEENTAQVINQEVNPPTEKVGEKKSDVKNEPKIVQQQDLPAAIFHIKIHNQAMFDAVTSERASRRQGTHKVKDRGEVRGGGKKPWRQKGTGRARAGSIRSPIWVGGGVAFGPTPERNYKLKINKKARNLALNSALSLKAKSQAILVHNFQLEKPSTKGLLNQINDLHLNKTWKKFLIINEDKLVFKSAQNVKSLNVNKPQSLSVEAILHADVIIFSSRAMERLVK